MCCSPGNAPRGLRSPTPAACVAGEERHRIVACDDECAALNIAVRNEHADIMAIILHHRAFSNQSLYVALRSGCVSGNACGVCILLKEGAPPWSSAYHTQPVDIAATAGHADVVRVLLHVKAAARDVTMRSACSSGFGDVVRALLAAGVAPNMDGPFGETLLGIAATNGHCDVIAALVCAGADPCAGDGYGVTPLGAAVRTCHARAAGMLIRCKADVDAGCIGGSAFVGNPLELAVGVGDVSIVDLLLAARAGPGGSDAAHMTPSPLYLAALADRRDVAARLVQARALLDAPGSRGHLPLHAAVQSGGVDTLHLLVRSKARVDASTHDGSTPMYLAASLNHEAAIRVLAQAKADMNHSNKCGATPLGAAATEGFCSTISALLENKAAVNASTGAGRYTPVMCAAACNHAAAVSLLLSAKADLAPTLHGCTPLSLAQQNRCSAACRLLIAAKANA